MKRFIKNHPELALTILAAAFLIVLTVVYVWGIRRLVIDLNKSIGAGTAAQATSSQKFDLDGARSLDLKGLVR